jgi:quinol monooxygenase YgiN
MSSGPGANPAASRMTFMSTAKIRFEQWVDEAALRTHFAVEGSKAFVKSLKGRIVETSGTQIYRAESIPR